MSRRYHATTVIHEHVNPKAEIRDPQRADEGQDRVAWAWSEMPVLQKICERFVREQPLAGWRVSACLHVTAETANLIRTLVGGGAQVTLCASNPLSTQDDVAAALVVHDHVSVFAVRGIDRTGYYRHIEGALAHRPQITLDDGADLVARLHRHHPHLLTDVIGGTEETTTGVIRLRAMAADGALRYPIVAVNDAKTKHLFDNRYGTGQSTIDGILRATNILLAGRTFTVAGYGWCGRGIAMRARGLGARVVVTEVDPVRALEATMDGYAVMPIRRAARQSDFVVTATGDKHVVDADVFRVAKNGCVFANAGHFNVELNLPALDAITVAKHSPRPEVTEHELSDGRRLRVLSEGRLVNLSAAEGHPSAVMDMSFANQALVVEYLARRGREIEPMVHPVPQAIDEEVARLKLAALGIQVDELTEEQQRYLASWQEGT
jgi:adenosylhomocysteinase